ncbi:transcriptional regulator with XRE-family HTH domain [Saccharothrix tamanrassetensis]|uniref:Transcriptional regulator with XRE-family HTH domain n=1 Tax=Saccharothrix tamanrassetensis TaxID=1051531 RepID=A0A841CSG4_9PSEU|nr:Scr1 family TA system antitoxin-like transcriptional regulator [Saccharothrix tamanrassetensis]MBB5960200.1 transcriptional regulator with XRE-family HTH domain [Saccharothrix tamanrassetensis]
MSFKSFVTKGYAEGETIRALAAATGRSYGTVRSVLVAEGVRMRKRGHRPATTMMAVADARARREELSAELLRARLASGLTGAVAGRRAGISQSKVSKVETGRLLPKVADVERLADVYDLPPEWRRRLLSLADKVARDAAHRRAVLHRGVARRQVTVARTEAAARTVRAFGVCGVPAQLLREAKPGQRLVVVLSEGALRSASEHWDRLHRLSGHPDVELGVIRWHLRVALPDAGFVVFDDTMVVFDLLAGNVVITDPDDVRGHLKTFQRLHGSAIFGDAVRTLLDTIRSDYEKLN